MPDSPEPPVLDVQSLTITIPTVEDTVSLDVPSAHQKPDSPIVPHRSVPSHVSAPSDVTVFYDCESSPTASPIHSNRNSLRLDEGLGDGGRSPVFLSPISLRLGEGEPMSPLPRTAQHLFPSKHRNTSSGLSDYLAVQVKEAQPADFRQSMAKKANKEMRREALFGSIQSNHKKGDFSISSEVEGPGEDDDETPSVLRTHPSRPVTSSNVSEFSQSDFPDAEQEKVVEKGIAEVRQKAKENKKKKGCSCLVL